MCCLPYLKFSDRYLKHTYFFIPYVDLQAMCFDSSREIATMTYRSGPEWEDRFGLKRIDPNHCPTLCPTFVIESYLEHQGEQFSTKYDPNSLLYISKVCTVK